MSDYYKLDDEGNPVRCKDAMEWAKWFETANRRIARDEPSPGTIVSTVFLGLDHNFGDEDKPHIYETMTFPVDSSREQDCERYSTREEALAGHARMVEKAKKLYAST